MSQASGRPRLRARTERKEKAMKIFVAGASGALGRQLVPLLADAGHEVVGTTTSPQKLETLRALGARPVSAWLPYAANLVGAKPPRHVPFWLGKLFAGEMLATMMVEGRGASNAKAKRELDWQPLYPSWREGFVNGLKSAA